GRRAGDTADRDLGRLEAPEVAGKARTGRQGALGGPRDHRGELGRRGDPAERRGLIRPDPRGCWVSGVGRWGGGDRGRGTGEGWDGGRSDGDWRRGGAGRAAGD